MSEATYTITICNSSIFFMFPYLLYSLHFLPSLQFQLYCIVDIISFDHALVYYTTTDGNVLYICSVCMCEIKNESEKERERVIEGEVRCKLIEDLYGMTKNILISIHWDNTSYTTACPWMKYTMNIGVYVDIAYVPTFCLPLLQSSTKLYAKHTLKY